MRKGEVLPFSLVWRGEHLVAVSTYITVLGHESAMQKKKVHGFLGEEERSRRRRCFLRGRVP